MAFWQPVADGRRQQLRCRSDHPGLAVQLARHDVEQLLDVALDNALRYAGPDATVTVSTAPRRHGRTGRQRRRPGLARRGPVQGGGTVLAGTGRQGRHRSRTGHRRRDRCGSRRNDRGGARARRRSAGALFACRRQVRRHAERPTVEMSRRAFLFATAVLAAGCIGSAPGGRVRLAAGERGGLYLAFAELLAEAAPGPLPRHRASR